MLKMLGSFLEMARLVRLYVRGPDMGGGVGGLLYTVRNPLYPGQGFAWRPNSFPDQPQVPQSITQRYNLSNGRGDVVAQSDSSGALTWTASYEAYGKRTRETGTNQDKQRANSKDEDPTGLLNEGMRYRDIETSVWLSRDPAGFVDGPNLYAYVRQNPWSYFDPHGLETHYLFYYVNPDSDKAKSFERAAQTQKREIESGKGFNPKKDKVVLKPITTAKDLTEGWKDMSEQSKRGGSEAVKNVKVFTHSGKGDDVDGPKIHLKGGSVGEKGIEGLPKAMYAKDAEINLHGCNSGVPGKKGNDSVAQNFADGQGVPATGQTGYAYFSEKTGEYVQIDVSGSPSTEVHLQAFNRGCNGYFGDSKNRAEAKAEPKKPALEKEKPKK